GGHGRQQPRQGDDQRERAHGIPPGRSTAELSIRSRTASLKDRDLGATPGAPWGADDRLRSTVKESAHVESSKGPLRSLSHREPAHRWSPDRALQLALRPPPRRYLRTPHRGYGQGAEHAGKYPGHPRGAPLARPRLGRGPRGRRSLRSLLPVPAHGALPRGHREAAGGRKRLPLLLHPRRARTKARPGPGRKAP